MQQRHLNLALTALLWFGLLAVSKGELAEVGGAAVTPERKKVFVDPAPPVVQKLPFLSPPAPQRHPDVQFHNQPKPLSVGAVTHNWESFLGPTHNAVSTETKLLKKWPSGGPTLVWEMKKGTSYTAPAILRDRLVYFHRLGNEETVECLHPETGARYWKFSYPTHFEDRYGYNNGPRASPVIDGDLVYTYGAEGKLHCLKIQTGQVYWKRDLTAEFHVPQDFFGVASTPLIDGDLLIINIGAPGGPCVAAFNKQNGRLIWGTDELWGPSYSSPIPALIYGRRRVFAFVGGESRPPTGGLLSIDPLNGELDFRFPWRSRSYESVNASGPVVIGTQVFVSASYKTGGAMVNVQPDGSYQVAWTTQDLGTHWNTSVYKDGYLYGFDGRNEPDAALVCIDVKTGKLIWRKVPTWEETFTWNGQPRKETFSTFRGSLLWADGYFLCLGELGHLLWLDLTPEGYREIARTWLFSARETWVLPVISRGLLYVTQNSRGMVRGETARLLCYDLRESDPPTHLQPKGQ